MDEEMNDIDLEEWTSRVGLDGGNIPYADTFLENAYQAYERSSDLNSDWGFCEWQLVGNVLGLNDGQIQLMAWGFKKRYASSKEWVKARFTVEQPLRVGNDFSLCIGEIVELKVWANFAASRFFIVNEGRSDRVFSLTFDSFTGYFTFVSLSDEN